MNQIDFLNKNVFFSTRQYAMSLQIPMATASRQLKKISTQKTIEMVSRGIWAQVQHPFYSVYGATPYILGNEQGYISFLTALHRHDVISQIPSVIQIATTGHGRSLSSAIADFELLHIQPGLMQSGIEVHAGKLVYNMATAEKALFYTLYISSRRGKRFSKFPELNWKAINKKEFYKLIEESTPAVQKLILPKFKNI